MIYFIDLFNKYTLIPLPGISQYSRFWKYRVKKNIRQRFPPPAAEEGDMKTLGREVGVGGQDLKAKTWRK